jgi:hypothetical protein
MKKYMVNITTAELTGDSEHMEHMAHTVIVEGPDPMRAAAKLHRLQPPPFQDYIQITKEPRPEIRSQEQTVLINRSQIIDIIIKEEK